MWRISESGRLIGVDEESLMRRGERISRKMYRLYGLIKKNRIVPGEQFVSYIKSPSRQEHLRLRFLP